MALKSDEFDGRERAFKRGKSEGRVRINHWKIWKEGHKSYWYDCEVRRVSRVSELGAQALGFGLWVPGSRAPRAFEANRAPRA